MALAILSPLMAKVMKNAIETNTKYGKKGKTFPRFIRGQMSLCGRRSKYQINEFLRARN